ncbi:MAG: type II toxin-antitoxin system RelE/ParE family toxin [Candidatus Kapaibacterium sp.]
MFFGSHFQEFFAQQDDTMKAKMVWTFQLIEEIDRVPETYLEHLTGTPGLYEIRVQHGNDLVRVFCFLQAEVPLSS